MGLFSRKKKKPKKLTKAQKKKFDQVAREMIYETRLSELVFPKVRNKELRLVEEALREQDIVFDNPDAGTEFDDRFFRVIEGVSPLDLSPSRIHSAQRLSLRAYRKNPRAFRAVEFVKDFVLGTGIKFRAADLKVQDVMDKFWRVNRWDKEGARKLRSLSIFGEQLYPAFVRHSDGLVRIGSISPLRLIGINVDKDNGEILTQANVVRGSGREQSFGDIQPFNIIRRGLDEQYILEKKDNAFYFAVNDISGSRRGLPDSLSSLDWLEGLDSFSFSILERASLATNVVFDIEYQGLKEDEIQDRVDQFTENLVAGGVYGHNTNTKLTVKTPQLAASDHEKMTKVIEKNVQAGTGIPGLGFANGEDLTRASANELTVPVAKMIESRQMVFKQILHELFEFAIEQAGIAGILKGVKDKSFEIDMPTVFLRDLNTVTTSIKTLTESLITGQDQNWITSEQAAAIYKTSLQQLGSVRGEPTIGGGTRDGTVPEEEKKAGEDEAGGNGQPREGRIGAPGQHDHGNRDGGGLRVARDAGKLEQV